MEKILLSAADQELGRLQLMPAWGPEDGAAEPGWEAVKIQVLIPMPKCLDPAIPEWFFSVLNQYNPFFINSV